MTDTAPDIKAIFVEALNLASDAERAAYLERACAGAPTVRSRVEALLGAIGQAGRFLETPALALAWEASREPGAGGGSTTLWVEPASGDAPAGSPGRPTSGGSASRPRRSRTSIIRGSCRSTASGRTATATTSA